MMNEAWHLNTYFSLDKVFGLPSRGHMFYLEKHFKIFILQADSEFQTSKNSNKTPNFHNLTNRCTDDWPSTNEHLPNRTKTLCSIKFILTRNRETIDSIRPMMQKTNFFKLWLGNLHSFYTPIQHPDLLAKWSFWLDLVLTGITASFGTIIIKPHFKYDLTKTPPLQNGRCRRIGITWKLPQI